MTRRIMVDIETLGLEPGAAILSIGAVEFDPVGLGDEFYREVSLASCQEAGLEVDAGTLEWWLDQDDAVTHILSGGEPLVDVLADFAAWFPEGAEIWANSPSFDCEMLERAYGAVGAEEPWEYYQERDVRTVAELPGAPDVDQDGDEHHALDDAKHQARLVSDVLDRLHSNTMGEA